MKAGPERACNPGIPGAKAPRGQIPPRLSSIRPILIPPSRRPEFAPRAPAESDGHGLRSAYPSRGHFKPDEDPERLSINLISSTQGLPQC